MTATSDAPAPTAEEAPLPATFNPRKHTIKVQGGREYLPVSARLRWFRADHPDWGIVTSAVEINLEMKYAIFGATIFNEEGKVMATATKMEDVKGFGDYMEKAETGSVGRALAFCGYGTPEIEDEPAPQNVRPQGAMRPNSRFPQTPAAPPQGTPATPPKGDPARAKAYAEFKRRGEKYGWDYESPEAVQNHAREILVVEKDDKRYEDEINQRHLTAEEFNNAASILIHREELVTDDN